MKRGYSREEYANPSMLDAKGGVGPYTVAEVRELNRTLPRRPRRATRRPRSLRAILTSDPIVWASFAVMVMCAVALGIAVLAVFTRGAI